MAWSMRPCSPPMMFCSSVGQPSFQTAAVTGPSTMEGSKREGRAPVVDIGEEIVTPTAGPRYDDPRIADVPALLLFVLLVCAMTPRWSVAAAPPGPDPDAGVPRGLAEVRARVLSDVRYDLAFAIPPQRTAPVAGRVLISATFGEALATLFVDFAADTSQVSSVEVDGRAAAHRLVNEHLAVSPESGFTKGSHEIAIRFTAGDAALNRSEDFLYTVFVPARARSDVSVLRPAGPEGARHADTRDPGRLAGGGQRGRARAPPRRGTGGRSLRRDAAAPDLPLGICRRKALGRDRRAPGPHVPDVPPRNRREEGRAQPRRDLRPARRVAGVARALHGHSLSVGQVRLLPRAGLSVRRHGAPRRDLLQRAGACCSTSPRRRTSCSAAPVSSRTRPPTCGSATS